MANEKLIRASDARKAILKEDPKLAYCIDDIPGVDAVEVKRGWWVCLEAEIGYFACSKCDHRILRAKCNYCPNCGADMRGDNDGK